MKLVINADSVLEEVRTERLRQDSIFGEQTHSKEKWLTILGEEFGEVCKAAQDGVGYRAELVQVAAVAVAMIECYDKQLRK